MVSKNFEGSYEDRFYVVVMLLAQQLQDTCYFVGSQNRKTYKPLKPVLFH